LYRRLDGSPSTTAVKNEWSCTSTSLIRLDDVDRSNFTFYLLIIPNFTASFKIDINNHTYWISYMVLNGMIIVNGEGGNICKPAVMANSNVTSQALFWLTAKGL
jgi:hypothetical protein